MADNKPTYDDVFMAILAMDTYHVGKKNTPVVDTGATQYDLFNLTGVEEDKGIGTATRGISRAHNEYGFFVASYQWSGKTVIAFRGTDQSFSSGPDVSHGYGIAFGSPNGGQATEAIRFYTDIDCTVILRRRLRLSRRKIPQGNFRVVALWPSAEAIEIAPYGSTAPRLPHMPSSGEQHPHSRHPRAIACSARPRRSAGIQREMRRRLDRSLAQVV